MSKPDRNRPGNGLNRQVALEQRPRYRLGDALHILLSHTDPERKPNQPLTGRIGLRHRSRHPSVLSACGRGMQGDVVKHGIDASVVEPREHARTCTAVGQEEVVEVSIVSTRLWHDRTAHTFLPFEISEPLEVPLPHL